MEGGQWAASEPTCTVGPSMPALADGKKAESASTAACGAKGGVRLDRALMRERLKLEMHIMTFGFAFFFFVCLTCTYMQWMFVFDPIESVGNVHNSLYSRFKIDEAKQVKTLDEINKYLDEFIKVSYGMASALVDASTLDDIDWDRCASSEVLDVCQMRYWSMPIDRPQDPEYVDLAAVARDTLAPSNHKSVWACDSPNPPANCLSRGPGSPNVDPELNRTTFGLTPEDPVILRSRLDFPLTSVVSLAPLIFTRRSPRVPCSGFGSDYNDNVLGAGSCSADSPCDPDRVTEFMNTKPNRRTGRFQSMFFSYSEPAFNCIDRSRLADNFDDKSWGPWASYDDLTQGRRVKAVNVGGDHVFYKFVSDVAYLQAPVELPIAPDHCLQEAAAGSQKSAAEACAGAGPACTDPLRWRSHPIWNETVGYGANCSLRKRWSDAYLSTPIAERRNTWLGVETTELGIAVLVITPQSAKEPDLVTVLGVTFVVGQYGEVSCTTVLETTSVTRPIWLVMCSVVAAMAILYAVYSFWLHRRAKELHQLRWQTWLWVDMVISLLMLAHVAVALYVELRPPDVLSDLQSAYQTNKQEEYFATFDSIRENILVLNRVKVVGFITCAMLFVRFIKHLTLHPQLAVLTETFEVCLPDLLQFFFNMIIIEVFLAWFGTIFFGTIPERKEYLSMSWALWAQFLMFINVQVTDPSVPPTPLYLCFLVIAVVVVVIALLNFLLAIVMDAYTTVSSRDRDNKAVGSVLSDVLDTGITVLRRRYYGWPRNKEIISALKKAGKPADQPLTLEELLELEYAGKGGKLFPGRARQAQMFFDVYCSKLGGRLAKQEEDQKDKDEDDAGEPAKPAPPEGAGTAEGAGATDVEVSLRVGDGLRRLQGLLEERVAARAASGATARPAPRLRDHDAALLAAQVRRFAALAEEFGGEVVAALSADACSV